MAVTAARPRVLVVEDDPDIASVLLRGLDAEGFAADWTADPGEALDRLTAGDARAAIIDRMLGPEDGLALVRHLRARGVGAALIVLSALARVEDRAEGLAAGADDYVVKPFQFAELTARLRVALLRPPATAGARAASDSAHGAPVDAASGPVRVGAITLDPARGDLVGPDGTRMALTERETALAACLFAHAGRVLPRHSILSQAWADAAGANENVVDVYVGYLRRKLAAMAGGDVVIRTLRGRGFVLETDR